MFRVVKCDNCRDKILLHTNNVVIIERFWPLGREFTFVIEYTFQPSYWVIPGAIYNGNRFGHGKFLRPSLSKSLFLREDRCCIPSAGIVENDHFILGVFTEPAKSLDDLSSVFVQHRKIVIRVPWAEAPLRYTGKNRFCRGEVKYFDRSRKYSRRFYIIYGNYRELGYSRGYHFFIHKAWEILGRRKNIDPDILRSYIKLKAEYAVNVHYYDDGVVSSFLQFVVPNTPLCGGSTSSGFTGKSLEAALALYRIYLINGDERLRDIAFKVANFHVKGYIKSGLFYTDYSIARKKWYGYFPERMNLVNTRQVGEALCSLLDFYVYANKNNEARMEWLLVAEKIGIFFVDKWLENGTFGKWWLPNGKDCVLDGTNGAYIIWLLAKLYRITEKSEYLKTAEEAMHYYIKEYTDNEKYWGDTLDADCIDKEAGHVLLRSALMLYEITGNEEYLDAAIRAGYYVLSWMYMWSIPFDRNSFLGRYGFDSFGWTSVSVENQHLDPYGIIIAPDFIRLHRYTGDSLWLETALAMTDAVINFVSCPVKSLGVSEIFLGFQPEQIYHTEWVYHPLLSFLSIFIRGNFSGLGRIMRGKGMVANSVFWAVAGCLNAALDIAELLGIDLKGIEIDWHRFSKYKFFRKVRDFIARINLFF